MMENDGYIKLIDFGFAIHLREDQVALTNLGNPIYKAPEVMTK